MDFVSTPPFEALIDEMMALPQESDKHRFVREVVLSPTARAKRGLDVPDDIVIQRSAFSSGRPTYFCVAKYVRTDLKVTVTI